MPTHEQDVEALLAEVRADPAQAEAAISALGERLAQLQARSDDLRAENLVLKRTGAHQIYAGQLDALRSEHRDLLNLAARHKLNPEVCTLATSDGHTLQFDPPAAFEQTLQISGQDDDSFAAMRPAWLLTGRRWHTNIYLTSSFRAIRRKASAYALAPDLDWTHAQSLDANSLRKAERIECGLCVDEFQPPKQMAIVTKLGWVRVLSWSAFDALVYSGQSFSSITDDDTPLCMLPCTAGDCLLATRSGKWLRFPLATVEPGGSTGILMMLDDAVSCACVIEPDTEFVHAIGHDGSTLTFAAAAFTAHKKPQGKASNFPRGFRPIGLSAGARNTTLLTLGHDAALDVLSLKRNPVSKGMGDAQVLNVLSKRLCAFTVLA
jgi:hypothetical protein